MNTMFNGMFMKVQKGLCMLSPCGIAIKTSSGYRSYDTRSGKLRNCDNLVFSFGDGLFFVIPSAKVPERHVFMGNTWFYGKIVSLFGDGSSICGKGGLTKMMKLMMMSSLFDNAGASADGTMAAPGMGNMNALMPRTLRAAIKTLKMTGISSSKGSFSESKVTVLTKY